MSSNDDNKSAKPVIRTTETDAAGSDRQANPNEENIVSGPGFFERLFGVPLGGASSKSDNRKDDGSGKPVFKNDKPTTSVPSVPASGTTPPPLPTAGTNANTVTEGATVGEGAAKVGDAAKDGADKTGESTGSDKPAEKKSYVFREPEGPFKPHYANTRAELIFDPPAPTVYMTPDAYKRMCLYVELAPKEVGWLGTVSKRPNGDFLIEEVFLVEQEVTSVETELSVEGTEKLVLELLEDGDPGLEKSNKLHFWGHSHVRMGTSPSGTDESTMQRFAREGHEYYLRGIFNKLGRGCFDVYYYQLGYRLLDVPWAVMDPATGKVILDRTTSNRRWWQGGRSDERPSYGYSQGGYSSTWKERQEEQARQQDERSGLAEFLKKDGAEKPAAEKPAAAVPAPAPKKDDPLEISAELRAEVTAEYKAKVKERYFAPFKSWFGGKKDDNDGDGKNGANNEKGAGDAGAPNATAGPDDVGSQVVDGDLIPTGKDVRPGGTPFNVQPGANKGGAGPQPEEKKGFFAWLGSLFESGPTPPQPYQTTSERPKKRCTPQNCNDPSHPWSNKYKGPKPSNPNNSADRLPDDAQ